MSEMEGRGIAADVVLLTTLLDACLKVHTQPTPTTESLGGAGGDWPRRELRV